MATYINVHTHIFSVNHVPNYVIGQDRLWLGKFLSVRNLSRINPTVLNGLESISRLFMGKRKAKRLFTFARLGLGTQQTDQYNTLNDYYQALGDDFRFVILPMDMEQMGGGEPNSNLYSQLRDIIEMRQNADVAFRLLPFVPVDPRRPEFSSGIDVLNFVRKYIEEYGFIGIKLYPALGYFPFDDKLLLMYEWAIQNDIPIMVHCIQGSIHWQGSMVNYQTILNQAKFETASNPNHIFQEDPEWKKLSIKEKEKNRGVFQRNFTQPENYEVLIELLKSRGIANAEKLKICLGHFGMDDRAWFTTCIKLVNKYENVYADISYVLAEDELDSNLKITLNSPQVPNRKTLFGTDFFVVAKEKQEDEILEKYLKLNYKFAPFADANAKNYLSSYYFTA